MHGCEIDTDSINPSCNENEPDENEFNGNETNRHTTKRGTKTNCLVFHRKFCTTQYIGKLQHLREDTVSGIALADRDIQARMRRPHRTRFLREMQYFQVPKFV